jgi:hypothetical protein
MWYVYTDRGTVDVGSCMASSKVIILRGHFADLIFLQVLRGDKMGQPKFPNKKK